MKFRKKPIVVEAKRFFGFNNYENIRDWAGIGTVSIQKDNLLVNTLEGVMKANVGDWIIKGVKGEFYPCKPDIFEATYEQVEEVKQFIREEQENIVKAEMKSLLDRIEKTISDSCDNGCLNRIRALITKRL